MADEPNRKLPDQYMLRLPPGLRDRIKATAEANGRSMNSEILAAIETRFPPAPSEDEVRKFFASMVAQFVKIENPEVRRREFEILRDSIHIHLPEYQVRMGALDLPYISKIGEEPVETLTFEDGTLLDQIKQSDEDGPLFGIEELRERGMRRSQTSNDEPEEQKTDRDRPLYR